jgi:3alpha(or 20beta)-hydroxysteroid dehydrogenase
MGRLDDKIALITGGARGQGAAEAERFAAEGATVYITDVRVEEGQATAERLGEAVVFLHHDVTSEGDWTAVLAAIIEAEGRIDVLVNNAGIFTIAGALETSLDDWNQMIAINQTGVFLGMQLVIPHMVDNGGGSVINISSIAGLRGAGTAFAYGASKWAVRGMTRGAAQMFAAAKVRVNSIHPGIIDTPMAHEFVNAGVMEMVEERIPIGHMAQAGDVANLALFLASDESSYCTGSEFIVDGGFTA